MDDAKKLLDSLMGQTRNVPLKEAKKKKGNNFKGNDVCKYYLIGFCPQHEDLFRNTKRHLGECERIHSDAMREEYEACPQKEEYEREYTRNLVRYLESIVRTADEAIARVQRNIQASNKELEERGPNDVAKKEIAKIRENCDQLLNESEELAQAGDIQGSKDKMAIFEQTKQKADDYSVKSMMPIKEEVCDVCGLRPEDGDGMRKFSHTEGKIHTGFVRVREYLKSMTEKQKDHDSKRDEDRKERRTRDKKEDPERDEERDKNEDRKGDGEPKETKEDDKQGADREPDQPRDKEARPEREDRGERERGRDRGDRHDRGNRGGERGGGDRRGAREEDQGYDRRGGDRERRGSGRDHDANDGNDRRSGGDRNYEQRGRGGDRSYGYGDNGRDRSPRRDQRRY